MMVQCSLRENFVKTRCLSLPYIVINGQNISVGVLGLVVMPILSAIEFLFVRPLLLSF